VERVARTFAERNDIAALFGSYDDTPAAKGIVSQYRNLLHHYTHQTSARDATTFWSGCGAVRSEIFKKLGGFDAVRYSSPSIEDIELGHRLRRAGHRILLDPELQAKHLKKWTLGSVIRTDITKRAIPWTQLILEDGGAPDDLNLKRGQRVCGLMTILIVLALPLALYRFELALIPMAAFGAVVFVNRDLYQFFAKNRGFVFASASVALHLLYYLYSSLSYVYAVAGWKGSLRRRSTPGARSATL
jgi:GT2 family glycosyltransferase